jgi:hypothetical protein
MEKKFFYTYNQDEKIIFDDGKEQAPFYSTYEAEKLYEKIIRSFKLSKYFNKLFIKKINIFSVIFQDLYWHYCFNFIKYENIFNKENLKNLELKQHKNFDNISMGMNRVLNYLIPSKINFKNIKKFLKNILVSILARLSILIFLIKNLLKGNTNKIWVYPDLFFHNNFKFFNNSIIKQDNLIVIDQNCFLSPNSLKFKSDNLNHALFLECRYRVKNYFIWNIVISILKPKKIILQDNLFNDFSLLLSAKIKKIDVVGVTHGLMTRFHKGNIGSKQFENINILKFDKIYVWLDEFKEIILKNSYIYNKKNVFVSGWLSSKQPYRRRFISLEKNKYVLHAFEINSNFREITQILKELSKKGFKIILKKRYPYEDYTHFGDINLELVSDFSSKHIEDSFCAVCNASTFYYNYLNMNIPVVIPKKNKDGYNFFSSNNSNVFEFSDSIDKQILSCKVNSLDLANLADNFIKEFR